MSIFTQPFFSAAGQKERLTNVVQTLKASLTGQGVQANTKSETLNKVLSTAASNPYTTAAVITPMNTISAAKAGFSALPAAGKVGVSVAVPVVVAASIQNPRTAAKIAETPRTLSQLGSISTADDVLKFGKEHPIFSGAAIVGGALVTGKAVSSAFTSIANTQAIKEQTKAIKESTTSIIDIPKDKITSQYIPPSLTNSNLGGMPSTPLTSVGNKDTSVKRYYKTKKKSKSLYTSPVRVTNKIMFFNKNG